MIKEIASGRTRKKSVRLLRNKPIFKKNQLFFVELSDFETYQKVEYKKFKEAKAVFDILCSSSMNR